MKTIFLACLVVCSSYSYGQIDSRIEDIRELYKDYNESISYMDNYEIKCNTGGSEPSMVIYTDFKGKVLIKDGDADEFGSSSTEYFFKNDEIQFIFTKSDRLLNHWSEETVRFRKVELRFYFDKGQIIKSLKKDFTGIEGKDDDVNLSSVKNESIDHKTDDDANWTYYQERIPDIIKLYHTLDTVFY
jgi:hypothetical protein